MRRVRLSRLAGLAAPIAVPLAARAAEAPGTASRAAWLLATWAVVSVAATVVVAIWFRARARANQQLSAEVRREDWVAARDETLRDREPVD